VVPDLLKGGHKDAQPIRGAHAALAALQELWNMRHVGWEAVRNDVRVGLVKETKDCGNTSVSMGLASECLTLLCFTTQKKTRVTQFLQISTRDLIVILLGS